MNHPSIATAEIFVTAFKTMPKKERNAIIEGLLKEKEFMEDLIDLAIIKQRESEPSRSLDAYLAERRRG